MYMYMYILCAHVLEIITSSNEYLVLRYRNWLEV